jgi:hypothetical protein
MSHSNHHLAPAAKRIPLKCYYCGETWTGSATMIGKSCMDNPIIGSVDVAQCDPEELVQVIDWDAEGGF